ncbi:UDP-N-acetylglucosamine diphosphorylase/glucosamine-1-phosphate N-acetyltransferase [Echinicola vietnamensis DSM 17526]|uniref:UDP-N-acetylglucosamine diphosphorylase/glucosamine-1-phosphate N-acetyltransferase n=2 Tax=Echinicola TaxID=390846 RepID=L0FZH1_ECHVK|nr:UDP-N-acetylglucosamine diphosphorylase/glucosamine-1-phosphate N-acetyltransferase [Echinicola vietnamensis DSM 17526]
MYSKRLFYFCSMEQITLFDDPAYRGSLLPFTFTRPVAEIRVGILKIREKWEKYLDASAGFLTLDYLQDKFPPLADSRLFINGGLCPDQGLLTAIKSLEKGQCLFKDSTLLAAYPADPSAFSMDAVKESGEIKAYDGEITLIHRNWHIFQYNALELRKDFALLTARRTSAGINDPHTIAYNPEMIFVEEGAKIRAAVLNAEDGPIYIGKDAQVQEGALIKGPFALCEGSTVNMGGKMRGDSTIGPFSKVGGEVSNSVIFGFSNKGHDGFMGNTVIGEWCNFGADTNISNLKNNYAPVKVWDYTKGSFVNTGLQFCGLMMGDHSKTGINTMFNTGTVVGVGANVFGAGFPRTFVPSFSWGAEERTTFRMNKFEETASKVMERRGLAFDQKEKSILEKVFDLTKAYRIWDKE